MDDSGSKRAPYRPALLQQSERLRTLNEIGRVVSSTLELTDLYETIYQQVGRLMDTSQFFIALRSNEPGVLIVPYLREYGKLMTDQRFDDGDSVTSLIIDSGQPFLFHNTEEYDTFERSHGLIPGLVGEEDSVSGIFVPLNTGNRTIGAMTVQSLQAEAYSPEDMQTLMVIASQAAVGIQNAQLYLESQQAVRRTQALVQVAHTITGSLDLQQVFDQMLEGMRDVLPYYLADVLLPNYETSQLESAAAAGHRAAERKQTLRIPFGEGVTGKVFQTGEPILLPDVRTFPGWIDSLGDSLSELAVPLRHGDEVIGVLDLERAELNAFSQQDLDLLSVFASQAAIAIQNARLFTDQRRRVDELQTIQSIVQRLTPLHEINDIAALIDRELQTLIDYTACRLFFLNPQTGLLELVSDTSGGEPAYRLQLGEGITGWIAVSGEAVNIPDMQADPRTALIAGTPDRPESMIGAPLINQGEVRGVITLTRLGKNQFDDNALRLLQIISGQAAIAFDRARVYRELRNDAVTDELTGLANRRYLLERFDAERSRAVRYHHTLVAMMIDIDKFKNVNDAFGHDAGDVVLRELASLVRTVVRAEDIVCRYGGEEFCVLLPEITLDEAQVVAQRLCETVAHFRLPPEAGVEHVTVSIGIALLEPEDDAAQLFNRADVAMYVGKRAGGNRVAVNDDGFRPAQNPA